MNEEGKFLNIGGIQFKLAPPAESGHVCKGCVLHENVCAARLDGGHRAALVKAEVVQGIHCSDYFHRMRYVPA